MSLMLPLLLLSFGMKNNVTAQDDYSTQWEWVWYDADSIKHTGSEFKLILENHAKWIEKLEEVAMEFMEEDETLKDATFRVCGYVIYKSIPDWPPSLYNDIENLIADSSRAILSGMNLTGALLYFQNLTGAILDNTNLTCASFYDADLTRAVLVNANLNESVMTKAKLNGAILTNANLSGTLSIEADFSWADLSDANLSEANLQNANFHGTRLNKADLYYSYLWGANLTEAILDSANLTEAFLYKTNLTGASFVRSNLMHVWFEPDPLPHPQDIAYSHNLDRLIYSGNPAPLVQIKRSLFNAGFKQQSKEVNAALNRAGASPSEYIFFDLTCEWGSNFLRPLVILLSSWGLFWLIYCFTPMRYNNAGKYIFATKKGSLKELKTGFFGWRKLRNIPKKFWIAFLFSTQRTLRIGFREVSPSHWLMMLLPPDFEMKSRGWPRFVSGIQSLLSVALIVLSLLSYFGRPFEF
jgi:uncharacterized protein YjbI with pentapeptide repeats